jgi:hypothetical protein
MKRHAPKTAFPNADTALDLRLDSQKEIDAWYDELLGAITSAFDDDPRLCRLTSQILMRVLGIMLSRHTQTQTPAALDEMIELISIGLRDAAHQHWLLRRGDLPDEASTAEWFPGFRTATILEFP